MSPVADSPDWFAGDEPRSDDEHRFLTTLRHYDAQWRAADLEPRDTTTTAGMVPLHVQVDVPGLPPDLANLQAGFWTSGPRGTGVEGEWGDCYLLEGGGPGSLTLFGLPAAADELAELTARWLLAQLNEPVDRSDWFDAGGDDVVASRWTLGAAGVEIGWRGPGRRRRLRRPADRVDRVR